MYAHCPSVASIIVTSAFLPLIRAGKLKRIYNTASALGDYAFVKQCKLPGDFGHSFSRVSTTVMKRNRSECVTFIVGGFLPMKL